MSLSKNKPLSDRCKYDHEFIPQNTYITPSGRRVCRECGRQRNKTYRGDDMMPADFSTFEFDTRHAIPKPRPVVCCARCRRGTKQYTANPVCGFHGRCKCHDRV